MGESYRSLFERIHSERHAYFGTWIHSMPMTVSPARDDELRELGRVLFACAHHYAEHYREWLGLIPYDDAVLETLEYCERYPFRAGTWRPDILLCTDGSIRVCEITSRFFGNGYFFSYFYDEAAVRKCEATGVDSYTTRMEEMLTYFAQMADGYERLVLVKSADRSDSIRLYVPFYDALGLKVSVFEQDEVERHLGELEGAFVVSALNQHDLASFLPTTRHLMADVGMRNDFRTIYLLHDKRFFRLFFEDAFVRGCLSEEETAFLRAHVVQTYLPEADPEVFEQARRNKDGFIMKHHCLGKSEKVYAGPLCTEDQWEDLFAPEVLPRMILQPFMDQRTFAITWQGTAFNDYACGSILTVDDRYFGPSLVRTSSCPVMNQGDDRKFAPIVTDQAERLGAHYEM